MDATLAPPRNQLDPLENHWNPLYFHCPALMRNSARQRQPGGQCENLTVIGKSSKTIGYSDISRLRKAWGSIKCFVGYGSVGSFAVGDPHNAHAKPSKPLENIAFLSILAGTRSTTRTFGIAQKRLARKNFSTGLAAYRSTKLIPRHAICIFN